MTTANTLILFSGIIYGCLVVTDHTLRKRSLLGSIINRLLGSAPLLLIIFYNPAIPPWVRIINIIYYGLMLIGTLFGCWIPYLTKTVDSERVKYFSEKPGSKTKKPYPLPVTPLRIITDLLTLICLWVATKL